MNGASTVGAPGGPCGYPRSVMVTVTVIPTRNIEKGKLTMELFSYPLLVCAGISSSTSPDVLHPPR
jgi:hypothetical protein